MRDILSRLGFPPRKVVKSKPVRKIKETDDIFDQVHQVNQQADADPKTIRFSIDCKAVVAIGGLSRGGKSRRGEHVLDHDFAPDTKLTPFGVLGQIPMRHGCILQKVRQLRTSWSTNYKNFGRV